MKQSQLKYQELIERNMDPNQNRKKEPFRAFNLHDDEEFSDSVKKKKLIFNLTSK